MQDRINEQNFRYRSLRYRYILYTDIEVKTSISKSKLRYRYIPISKFIASISAKTSISVYTDIEVRNFDIVKSSISLHTDIEAQTFDIGKYSISLHTDIEVQNFDIEV